MQKKRLWKPRKIVGGVPWPLVLLAVFPAPANAYPRPGVTQRVSVASDGAEANSHSIRLDFARRQREIGQRLSKHSPREVSAGRPLTTGRAVRRTRGLSTEERTSNIVRIGRDRRCALEKERAMISADGRYVAFQSAGSDLVPGDTNGSRDVFLRDREIGTLSAEGSGSDLARALIARRRRTS